MGLEKEEKRTIIQFFKGFLIAYFSFGLCNLLLVSTNFLGFWPYILSLLCLVILFLDISRRKKGEFPYLSQGMMVASIGLLHFFIKRNNDTQIYSNSENPRKWSSHFSLRILLSICLILLYLPYLFIGYIMFTAFGLLAFPVIGIILLNIFLGVIIFFFTEILQ
ncbi:hypothetical protein DSAG12_02607 [Promethearchaeum syntrophicum]|uniref:Uncharacterized protein n=1 Tax=Promethearchaeum syntrophicum TaxID=2594042 RepID=A0A5B9DD28_9ARCH|nr:hypothetical protein [Candidatus Prometheoarchaeum syntrophicum]